MFMNTRKFCCLAVLVAVRLGVDGFAQTQPSTVGSMPTATIWELERVKLPMAAGSGVSFDGQGKRLAILVAPEKQPLDSSLYLIDLESGRETVLWDGVKERRKADQPSLAAEGTRAVFVARGDTRYYPSDIFTVLADGTGLKQLTQSRSVADTREFDPNTLTFHGHWSPYQRYYDAPSYSPDSSLILLHIYDALTADGLDRVAVMKPDGSALQIVADGRPCCWSADGKAIYYENAGVLTRLDLATRSSILRPSTDNLTPVMGRMKDREWFAYMLDNRHIGWFDFEKTTLGKPSYIGEWSVPAVKMNGAEEMKLKGFQWSDGSEVLLWYQGDETERFEVVRIANPGSISR
jgi:hypothetical protein